MTGDRADPDRSPLNEALGRGNVQGFVNLLEQMGSCRWGEAAAEINRGTRFTATTSHEGGEDHLHLNQRTSQGLLPVLEIVSDPCV